MSQKKGDEYKEQKKNRREQVAKEKKEKAIKRVIGWVVAGLAVCGLLVGIIVTIVNAINANKTEEESYYLTENALLDYAEIVSSKEPDATETEAAVEEEAEEAEAEEAETEDAENAEASADTEAAEEEAEPAEEVEDTEAEAEADD